MIKLCLFSDYHYNKPCYPIKTDGMNKIIEKAHENGVDAIIHCGDLAADSINSDGLLDTFLHNRYGIPAYGCIGNHELEFVPSLDKVLEIYNVKNNYFYYELKGFRIIFLDTNYWKDDDGTFYHYPGNSVGSPKGWAYDQNLLGEEQLDWLEKTIDESKLPCIIVSHVSLEENGEGDWERANEIINKANRKTPKKVLLCLCGHYHRNRFVVKNNVIFAQINATYNGEWRPQKHNLFPEEYAENGGSMVQQISIFRDPLSCIATLDEDGHFTVKGMKTSYEYDISPEMYGGPFPDGFGSICEPFIPDIDIKLD